jgi:HPt (histidine-containing phosphotransfer) domain-containing protein
MSLMHQKKERKKHIDTFPVTRFSIQRKPEWTDIDFGSDYRTTFSVLGNRLLLAKSCGYATFDDVKKTQTLIDKEFMMELLDGFIKSVRAQIETIRTAISQGDADKVRTEAHSIKGDAANICADNLSGFAFELEKIGKSGILEKGDEALAMFEEEFHRLGNHAGTEQ